MCIRSYLLMKDTAIQENLQDSDHLLEGGTLLVVCIPTLQHTLIDCVRTTLEGKERKMRGGDEEEERMRGEGEEGEVEVEEEGRRGGVEEEGKEEERRRRGGEEGGESGRGGTVE